MNQILLSVTVCHPLSVPRLKFYQVRANLTLCAVSATLLPRDAELLAFEAACGDYCEREVDEVEWQGGRVYLHLGVRRDNPPRG
jgi:hypothetical protein